MRKAWILASQWFELKNLHEMVLEKDDGPSVVEDLCPVLGYELQFLSSNETIHKVDVRSVNFQDVIRHLRHGEAVLITPRLQENPDRKKPSRGSWYFTHS